MTNSTLSLIIGGLLPAVLFGLSGVPGGFAVSAAILPAAHIIAVGGWVAIATALLQDAPLLLLDEPASHLDLGHQHLLLGILHDHAARGGAVVASLHDLNLAWDLASHVVLLDGLLRLEWSDDGGFEDRASTFAVHRDHPTPEFTVNESAEQLEIVTDRLHLTWDRKPFDGADYAVSAHARSK